MANPPCYFLSIFANVHKVVVEDENVVRLRQAKVLLNVIQGRPVVFVTFNRIVGIRLSGQPSIFKLVSFVPSFLTVLFKVVVKVENIVHLDQAKALLNVI